MKRLYLFLIAAFIGTGTQAQPSENSWINYSQSYYKIKVWQDGVYRLQANTMMFAGIPVSVLDHRNIQIFHNGQEQYLYVYDQNGDHHINGNDYIEFYGQRNDGSLDAKMYRDPDWQPNANFSLFTDTSVYFLTYNSSLLNKRFTVRTDTAYTSYNSANYFIKNSYKEETGYYNAGTTYGGGTEVDYTESEGWVDGVFYNGSPVTKTLNTQNVYSSGPNFEINTAVVGSNSNPHSLLINFPGVNFSDSYTGYAMKRYNFSVSPAAFTSATTNFTYTALYSNDHDCFVYLSVKYPHTYNLENTSSFKMLVPDDGSQLKTRMDITNFNLAGSGEIILYDLTNHKRYPVVQSGNTFHALVDNDGQSNPKNCFLASGSQVTSVPTSAISSFTYVNNNPSIFNNFLSAPVDSAYIIITHRSLWNQVGFYKAHRDLTTNNKVVLVDIDELYDQFAYGIKKHPLAIKNFVKFLLDNWTGVHPPQALFLIGKSIAARDCRYSGQNFMNNLVPSYGNPPSDILLTNGINGSIYDPKVPTGRLSAQNTTHVTDYLQKVQDYETAQNGPPQPWMKEVLHFGGGSNTGEQLMIQGFLNEFKTIIEDTLFGGHVTSYFKSSSAPMVIDPSIGLQHQVDTGVALMTFFGHASGAGFDQSTDVPENYGNHGRYPVVIANSCFAGDIHTSSQSISERFVTLDNKGSVAFIASVGLGDAGYLYYYCDSLYHNISHKFYGEPVGKLMQQTILQVQDSNELGKKTVCQEMTLEGDPILKMNSWKKPDYLMLQSNIFFSPNNITTDLDTFTVHVIVRNIAKAVPDSFNVIITRTFPNGIDSVYIRRIAHCNYGDTLQLTMNVSGFNSAGINTIRVDVDLPEDSVPEIDDHFNNTASTTLFITSHDILPVYPQKFAIVPYSTTALKASTSDPLVGIRTYRFEMDTSYQAFGNPPQPSPAFHFTTLTDSGGVITWNNNIPLMDSVVYYWRVANDSVFIDPAKYKWQESSFIHIPAKTGWSQKHFYQFNNDAYNNVVPDSTNRKFNFIVNHKSLRVESYGTPSQAYMFNQTGYTLNNTVGEYNGCGGTPAVMIAVFDSITLEPWTTCGNSWGQANTFTLTNGSCTQYPSGSGSCRSRPENYFIFRYNDPSQMTALNTMLNSIPNGDYILAYSWFNDTYSNYPAFSAALSSVGFQTPFLQDLDPYIFFMKKGDPTVDTNIIGQSSLDSVNLTMLMTSVWDRGTIATELIGPATQWHELHWKNHPYETGTTKDSSALNIYGFNQGTGTFDTLRYGMQTNSFDTTLSWIPASQYPYLKMEVFLKDETLRTPPHMDKWQIYFDESPECAVNANNHFSFHGSPMAEGDTIRMSIAIDNIANKPLDSLTVDFYMYDHNRIRHNIKSVKLDSLRVGQSLLANVEIDTTFGLAGNNSLWVEANPYGTHHQKEQYHFNNLAEMKFNISRDVVNPILDVTFDAIHILDGDIVSGKPTITIQLHDENKFLALNDTADFRLYLKTPTGNAEQRIFFSAQNFGNMMRFTPAVLPKNSCRIDWNPVFTEDGVYILEVEAADKSKNESGRYNYKISFEVVNHSTITEVLNYPNPFSTSTRFVFLLTGNEIPTYMKIQVMTVTGKIVREITQEELGNIHIGRNITDYAWDGKDEFGDQLANGIYLYRVITNLHGDIIEHRETEADKFFKKGWGKMYLMR
ncbi:MAG: C25 family cysteine peptidase [Bacteroidetes bacterium]|nr:C25 family cysteine peptidase [Bacteroidota bacterium]